MKTFPGVIPVFPLSGVIYFPKTNLPLNIFEKRYLDLVNDTYNKDKLMGMVQAQKSGNEVFKIGCLGKISDFQKSEDGRILINLTGITRFKINQEIENNQPYREFLVNYDLFKDDLQSEKMKVKNELLIKLINNSKNFFKKNGILINWKELSKLSSYKQIYNLAMISPISVEEKQKLLEIVELEEIANILNDITKLNFYEFPNKKNILQ